MTTVATKNNGIDTDALTQTMDAVTQRQPGAAGGLVNQYADALECLRAFPSRRHFRCSASAACS